MDLTRIVDRFQRADRNTRLEMLLDFSDRLPSLPEKYREAVEQGLNRIHECQTPVFLFPEISEGRFVLHAEVPREAPTVRGFVSLLIKALREARSRGGGHATPRPAGAPGTYRIAGDDANPGTERDRGEGKEDGGGELDDCVVSDWMISVEGRSPADHPLTNHPMSYGLSIGTPTAFPHSVQDPS